MRRLAIAFALLALASPAMAADFHALTAFRAYGSDAPPPPTWTFSNGIIHHEPGGGDIISVESFGDFELTFDWRIAPEGNSGVMYRVDERFGAPYQSGPEYQILDNAGHADGKSPLTSAASAYGLYAPSTDASRPAGEWNSARIVVKRSHVEHWLNGHRVVSYDLGSPDWLERVKASKFASWPGYGQQQTGHITLQDHGNVVDFRNLLIRPL